MILFKKGSNGPAVEVIQKALKKLGKAKIKPDEFFGPKTEKAVIAFQIDAKLKDDGKVGPETAKALKLKSKDLTNKTSNSKKMKTYLDIRDATVKSIYDTKMKKKVIEKLGKSAKVGFAKGSELSISKPSGWDSLKDKGFLVAITLESLTKKTVKNEIHFSAKVKVQLASLNTSGKSSQWVEKVPVGTGTVKNSVTKKNLDDEAVYIAGYVLSDLIKKSVIPLIKSL